MKVSKTFPQWGGTTTGSTRCNHQPLKAILTGANKFKERNVNYSSNKEISII